MRTHRQPAALGEASGLDVESRIEDHLRNLEERLETLSARVHQAQQLAAMGTVAATLAHECSNVFTSVLNRCEYALESGDLEQLRRAVETTVRNIRAVTAVADRLLKVSAAKTAGPQDSVVRTAVEEAVLTLPRDLSREGIRFSNDVPPELSVWADSLHLHQVFFNLLLNARDALVPRRAGRIAVGARRESDRVIITVKDDGPGISPAALPHVFDPLYSSKSASTSGEPRCCGLGLALCHDLVTGNGGEITAESTPDHGTTFTIVLPVTAPSAPVASPQVL